MSDLRATGLILVAMLCFAVQDVIVKFTAGEVSLWQMQLVRSIAVLVLLATLLRLRGRMHEFAPRRWRWPFVRAVIMSGAYLFFYAALPYMPLAKAASAFFIGPILITLFAALFLGEPIGPRRVAAVIVGFLGVLFIVQPGFEGWSPVAILPVLAAVCYALGVVLTRWRCRDDPGFSLTMVNSLVYAAIGLAGVVLMPLVPWSAETRESSAFLTSGWQGLDLWVFALLLLTACTHILGAVSSVNAYQIGEASRLAPIEYIYLVIMGAFDYAIWGSLPQTATLIGMVLICGSGGFVAWREGRSARPRMQQTTEVPWTPEHSEEPSSVPSEVKTS